MTTKSLSTLLALGAAALYAVNIPLSKLLLTQVQPAMMAAFLYLGAGLGLFVYGLLTRKTEPQKRLTRKELPYTLGMILLDIAAPILLMAGLQHTHAHTHTHDHVHRHGTLTHQHPHDHVHTHLHTHGSDESDHGHSHGDIPEHDHSHADAVLN